MSMPMSVSQLITEGAPIGGEDAERFVRDGWWAGRTIRSVLADAAAAHPTRDALVGYRTGGTVTRWSYADLDREATHAASVLAELGVRAGDAVAVMLPNWVEYGAVMFGAIELGAVYTGIPVAYGERQMAAILRRSKARVLVIPRRWRGVSHLELARTLRAEIPTLETLLVLDDEPGGLDAGEFRWSDFAELPARPVEPRSSDEICYLGFTSGTTGEPKGAMHSHDTLLYSALQLAEHVGATTFGEPAVQLVASPVGHHTGFIWGVVFTVCLGGTGIHIDRWDPAWGTDVIRTEGVTTFFGAPTFVQDMLRTDLADDPDCPLNCLVVAGASVPRTLPEQARRAFGAHLVPAWGMTECSIIISATPAAPDEIFATDGSVFTGAEAALLSSDGRIVSEPGAEGELVVRGPSLFLGYYERPDATESSFLPGSWFRTGDTASIDEHGWISLRGRTKDVVIRGGENIPVTDIETLLFGHPLVLNAAVVGIPDERLGERACAVVTLVPGAELELPELCDHLLSEGLSKHFLPERLIVMDELPMTQSGKIQKFRIRDMIHETVHQGAGAGENQS